MAKHTAQSSDPMLPRLQFPTFTLPTNARVSEKYGRRSIMVASATLPVPTIVGDVNLGVSFWGELKTTAAGTEYHVSASFDRGISAATQETRDALLDHVERHAMRWAHWNGAYDAGHAALTGAATKRIKLGRTPEPEPRLVDNRGLRLPTAEAQKRRAAAKPAPAGDAVPEPTAAA